MIPGINPKQMQKAMKRLGIQQQEIDAEEVIIRCKDKELVIKNPQVSKVNMMGQETFQVIGDVEEHQGILKEDIETVAEQADVSLKEAEKSLKENNGDLAAAILSLKK